MKKKIASVFLSLIIGIGIGQVNAYAANPSSNEAKKFEIVKELEKNKAMDLFKEALNKAKQNENFQTEFTISMAMEGVDLSFQGNGIYDIKNNMAMYEIKASDKTFKSYLKDGENYYNEGEAWKFEKTNEKVTDAFTAGDNFDASFLGDFTVGETNDALTIIKNKEPLNINKLKSILTNKSSIFSSMLTSFDNVATDDAKVNLTMVIDKDKNFKEIIVESDMTQNDKPLKITMDYNFLNYNKAEEIKIPQEALKAKSNPETSSNTNN